MQCGTFRTIPAITLPCGHRYCFLVFAPQLAAQMPAVFEKAELPRSFAAGCTAIPMISTVLWHIGVLNIVEPRADCTASFTGEYLQYRSSDFSFFRLGHMLRAFHFLYTCRRHSMFS
jgi:hypothetical protein